MYTEELSGFSGISGLVNTTDTYGIDLYAESGNLVGLGSVNSYILDSYNIPANDKKLTLSDFNDLNYDLYADFSNAGYGDYEVNIVIELAVQ